MNLLRLVVSDLHIGTGILRGELNPSEDFYEDDRFAEMLAYYDQVTGEDTDAELILNGDIFDLLKVKVKDGWPTEITEEISTDKLRKCLEGHPKFVAALRSFISRGRRRIVYLPGNHDIEMWFEAPQELFRAYVAPGELSSRVRFITDSDTYYLPEGIQIQHGHQFERIHRMDYARMTRKRRDRSRVLNLRWGHKWILEVVNPAKQKRSHIDRILPLELYLLGALVFDTFFAISFSLRTAWHYMRHRVFAFRTWPRLLSDLPSILREEIFAIGGYDDIAIRSFLKLRGVHTLIVGHSHAPRYRALPNGKVFVNTGTWMRMINLKLPYLGLDTRLTYGLIEYPDGRPQTKLMCWHGTQPVCEPIPYAD
jgi:UDP-2,3-diacylglucosamine pyrophosphatase LpxH